MLLRDLPKIFFRLHRSFSTFQTRDRSRQVYPDGRKDVVPGATLRRGRACNRLKPHTVASLIAETPDNSLIDDFGRRAAELSADRGADGRCHRNDYFV